MPSRDSFHCHHHGGWDAFPNIKLLDHNLHRGLWSSWVEGKWLFLILLGPVLDAPLSQPFSLWVIYLFFFVSFWKPILWLKPERHESQSLSKWIIHIIINLLISWYVKPVTSHEVKMWFRLPKGLPKSQMSLQQVIGVDILRFKCCIYLDAKCI